jgi:predicted transcriptional regulator of viral defense system
VRTADAYGELLEMNRPLVTTREAATRLREPISGASRRLRWMEEAGLVRRLRQGLWALHADIEPFAAGPYLTAPFPAYVSLWSALSRHGMIDQIPRQISIASLARTQRIETAIGIYQIHHLAPEVFGGFEGSEETGYVAKPEKALFDTVYVRAAAGTRAYFTELSLPATFDDAELKRWTKKIKGSRLQTLVSRHLRDVVRQAERERSPSAR